MKVQYAGIGVLISVEKLAIDIGREYGRAGCPAVGWMDAVPIRCRSFAQAPPGAIRSRRWPGEGDGSRCAIRSRRRPGAADGSPECVSRSAVARGRRRFPPCDSPSTVARRRRRFPSLRFEGGRAKPGKGGGSVGGLTVPLRRGLPVDIASALVVAEGARRLPAPCVRRLGAHRGRRRFPL
jgi:hypothetical protein